MATERTWVTQQQMTVSGLPSAANWTKTRYSVVHLQLPSVPQTSKSLVWLCSFNYNLHLPTTRLVQRHDATPKQPLDSAYPPVHLHPQQAGAQQRATVMQAPVFHSGTSTKCWYVCLLILSYYLLCTHLDVSLWCMRVAYTVHGCNWGQWLFKNAHVVLPPRVSSLCAIGNLVTEQSVALCTYVVLSWSRCEMSK